MSLDGRAPCIPVMNPQLPQVHLVTPYLASMDETGWYANRGPLVTKLEARLAAERFGVDPRQVVVCASGTVGLTGALTSLGVGRAHVPAFTFPATLLAACQSGARIELHDISADTWMLDPRAARSGPGTALVPVLPFGAPFTIKPFSRWETVVVDAAASVGGSHDALRSLPANWAVVYSLHATKIMGCGEGGVVVFGDEDAARRFRAWINFGFSGDRTTVIVGTNGKMPEAIAAYGLAGLDGWRSEKSDWTRVNAAANEVSSQFGIRAEAIPVGSITPYWIVEFKTEAQCQSVERSLAAGGVGTRRWWSAGCHRMPAFRHFRAREFPVTDDVSSRTLGLPCFRSMTDGHFEHIARLLADALGSRA